MLTLGTVTTPTNSNGPESVPLDSKPLAGDVVENGLLKLMLNPLMDTMDTHMDYTMDTAHIFSALELLDIPVVPPLTLKEAHKV